MQAQKILVPCPAFSGVRSRSSGCCGVISVSRAHGFQTWRVQVDLPIPLHASPSFGAILGLEFATPVLFFSSRYVLYLERLAPELY